MFTRLEELNFLIEPEIHQYCGPLFFTRSLTTMVGVNDNGTYGLVDTGKRKLLITNQHVVAGFENEHHENPETKMIVCLAQCRPGIVLDIKYLIDQDQKLDVATFDLDPLMKFCESRKFFPLNQSPAPRVKKGDSLAFVGYPGKFRANWNNGLQFGGILYMASVSDVSGNSVVADFSKVKTFHKWDPELNDDDNPNGGISGSPCFLVKPNRPVQLVGITNSQGLNLLRFTHVDCLNPDGTINKQTN